MHCNNFGINSGIYLVFDLNSLLNVFVQRQYLEQALNTSFNVSRVGLCFTAAT